jgi:sugar/nucleoside kinase (ribokinase family)
MVSNLVTPPDLVNNDLCSVLLVDPEQPELDAVVRFCQYADRAFNVYVYTPNMNNREWLDQAVAVCDAVVVNSKSNDYKDLCLLEKTYYYGDRIYLENDQKIHDPLHYFALKIKLDK